MPNPIADSLQLIGPADWKIRGRAGNDALLALALQANLMIAQAGAPTVQTWSPREYSGTSPVMGWPLRWCVPGVPKVRILVVYEYDGAEGDGGVVRIKWSDPAVNPLADLGFFLPLNGGPQTAVLTGDVEGEEGPDYFLGLEAQTASGKTITIHSLGLAPMVPAGGDAPATWLTGTGVKYTQLAELEDDAPVAVDLERHLMGDPWDVFLRRGSTFLQRWEIDGTWNNYRGLSIPVSYTLTTALEIQTPILSTGKPWRLWVRGYASTASGAMVTAGVDLGTHVEALIPATALPAWDAGWTYVDHDPLTPGPHVLDVSVIPPPAGTVFLMGISAFEIPAP